MASPLLLSQRQENSIIQATAVSVYLRGHMKHVLDKSRTTEIMKQSIPQKKELVKMLPKISANFPGKGHVILIVDDNETIRNALGLYLKLKGFEVLIAGKGIEAMEISNAFQRKIDVMISDVVMPEMTGLELARRISAERPTLKTIFMSGYTDERIKKQRLLNSRAAFLQKPVSMEVVLRTIDGLMKMH